MTDDRMIGGAAGGLMAIASGKGGVGKTVLTLALAQSFARAGERVLVFDGDLGMANIDVQLGLSPRADLGAVVSGRISLERAVSPALGGAGGKAGHGGFDVIAGRSGSGALAGLSADRMAGLATGLAAMSLRYDRVLMDMAPGAEPALLRLAAAADEVLVVLTDEPTAITDGYAFVKMLRMRDDGACPRVAVNMADSIEQGRRVYDGFARTCRAFLDFDPRYAGAVRRDAAVRTAIRRQQALLEHAPGCPAGQDIAALAESLRRAETARAA